MRISVPTVRHSEGAVLHIVSPQVVASGQSAMDACINPKSKTPNRLGNWSPRAFLGRSHLASLLKPPTSTYNSSSTSSTSSSSSSSSSSNRILIMKAVEDALKGTKVP